MSHTPEPLSLGGIFHPDSDDPRTSIWGPRKNPGDQSGTWVAQYVRIDDAPRLIATYNACAGIPTEALEADVVRRMRELLEELASDLASELNEHYPRSTREQYPSQHRLWLRDMEPVDRTRAILRSIDGEG